MTHSDFVAKFINISAVLCIYGINLASRIGAIDFVFTVRRGQNVRRDVCEPRANHARLASVDLWK